MPIEEMAPLDELRRRVFQIERLQAMPLVITRLVEALASDRTTPATLEKIIESDQALACKLLSLANSAYYGFSQKITTMKRAIVIIGFRELQLLALGAGLAGLFDMRKVPPGFDGEGLWIHSLVVSWAARELAEASKYSASGEIMIAGLLHDLGKLVLATHLSDYYVKVLEKIEEGVSAYEAEEQLGLKHTTVGNWLAKKWCLPDVHIAAIRDHHSPRPSDPHFKSTGLIYMADTLAKKLGFGLVQQARPLDMAPVMRATNLTVDLIRTVAMRAKEQVPPMLNMWQHMFMEKREFNAGR